MGVFSTKVVAGVLATGVIAGGVMFTGGETVDNVKSQLEELKNKVVQYDANESSLLDKIGFIKADAADKLTTANGKIVDAKTEIKNLEANKSKLESEISHLQDEITSLRADITDLTENLAEANATIAEKEELLASKMAELDTVNSQLTALQDQYSDLEAEYQALVETNNANASEAERANEEVTKANEKVAELGEKSEEVKEATADAEPLTAEELEAVDTEVSPDVYDAELVVKNLKLTYIQDGQSEKFKSEHPDLDIKEGDRVWRITNENKFDVYVEYKLGGKTGEVVANPSQTFYMTEQGGTMIIKWQDQDGVWQQTVKAGQ